MKAHTFRRRKSRRQKNRVPNFYDGVSELIAERTGNPTGGRPAADILPTAPRPIIERPVLPHNRQSTHCPHGVDWRDWCERCERGEITRAVDTGEL